VDWLRTQVLELCAKHHARLLDPDHDVSFIEDEMEAQPGSETKKPCFKVVVVIDGWDHMHALPELTEHARSQGWRFEGYDAITASQYSEFVDVLASDSEDEGDAAQGAEEMRLKEEAERKKLEEEVLL
jgi:hypothetical protein